MTRTRNLPPTLFACAALTIAACSEAPTSDGAVQRDLSTPDTAFERLTREGLTCGVQTAILELSDDDREHLGELAQAGLRADERGKLLDGKEANCVLQSGASSGELGTAAQAITGTWQGVAIPETSGTGGYYPTYLTRDSLFYSWMCNSGSPESPADWILEYHVPGAYNHRSSLKIRGTNSVGSCYTHNPTASRVYSDDDIRTCVGYWQALLCGVTPTTYETVIWW